MTSECNGVEVTLTRLKANPSKFAVLVRVKSRTRMGLLAENEIDPTYLSKESLLERVGLAAAACAEYLCERYKDRLDPSQCAKWALNALEGECRWIEARKESNSQKIKMLGAKKSLLTDVEREFLERINHYWLKDAPLTPEEVLALNLLLKKYLDK